MQKYEYLLVAHVNYIVKSVGGEEVEGSSEAFGAPKGPQVQELANELGQQGWEMVSAQYSHFPNGPGFVGDVWFKRPLP